MKKIILIILGVAVLGTGFYFWGGTEEVISPSENDGPKFSIGTAMVEAVEIEEVEGEEDGQTNAVVTGNFPDSCTTLNEVRTRDDLEAKVIEITITTKRPNDQACAQVLTPFEEAVPLPTEDLPAGVYTVKANEAETELEIK